MSNLPWTHGQWTGNDSFDTKAEAVDYFSDVATGKGESP